MGQQKYPIKTELYTSLKTESSIVADGLTPFNYLQSYAGVDGFQFANDRSGLIDGACAAAKDYSSAKTARYEMSLSKWATLIDWALSNPTLNSAKIILSMSFKLGQLKEAAVATFADGSTFIDSTAGALKAAPFGFQLGINYPLTSTVSMYNRQLLPSSANAFVFNVGAALDGTTLGGTLYNTDLSVHTTGTSVVSSGVLTLSLTTSSFSSGYFVLNLGTMFAAADYSSILTSDIRLNDFFVLGLHGSYMTGG